MANPTRTVTRKGGKVRQMKCLSECGQWRNEEDFHFRTPERKHRSSRCKFCAAKAQADLRKRKKGLLPRKPRGRYGLDEVTSAKES